MTIQQFTNLMKQGNKAITGGIINLFNAKDDLFVTLAFDDMSSYDGSVNLSYMDHAHENRGWQGERSPFFTLIFADIKSVKQMPLEDNLYGDYRIEVEIPNMTVQMYFDIVKGLDLKPYDLIPADVLKQAAENFEEKSNTVVNNKVEMIQEILAYKGSFFVNINAADFVQNKGYEAFTLIFTSIRTLRSKELLTFDNHDMKPVTYKDDGKTPVYDMSISTNFYVEVNKIEFIEELDADKWSDVFEYPTKRIFNLHMDSGDIITIGLMD